MHPAIKVLAGGFPATSGISFVEGAAVSAGANADSLTLPLTDAAEGDFAVVWFYSDVSSTAWKANVPAGMTRVATPAFPILTTTGRSVETDAFYGFVGAAQTNIVISKASGVNEEHSAAVAVFRGVDSTSPFAEWPSHAAYVNDTTPTSPPITTAVDDVAIVSFVCYSHNDHNYMSPPPGQMIIVDLIDGFARSVAAGYRLRVAAGTHSPGNWTAVGDVTVRAESHAATFALRPS